MTTFVCPYCRSRLKLPASVLAGKHIQCPQCGRVFAPAKAGGDASEPEVEETPRSPKRKKKKSRRGLWIGLGVGGAVLGLLTVLAVIWSLGVGVNQGTGEEDPLAYVPADSGVVISIEYGALLDHPELGQWVHHAMLSSGTGHAFADIKKTGLDFRDLYDRVIIAIPGNLRRVGRSGTGSYTVIIQSRTPFSQRKIRDAAKEPRRQTIQGKSYYRVNEGDFRILFMPSDRIVILSGLQEDQLEPVFASDGVRRLLPPEVLALADKVRGSQFWMVAPFDDGMRREIQQGMQQRSGAPAELAPALEALGQGRVAAFWGALQGRQVQLNVALTCQSEQQAQQAAGALLDYWKQQNKGIDGLLGLAMLPQQVQGVTMDLMRTMKFSSQGPNLQVSAQVSQKTIADLMTQAARMQ